MIFPAEEDVVGIQKHPTMLLFLDMSRICIDGHMTDETIPQEHAPGKIVVTRITQYLEFYEG